MILLMYIRTKSSKLSPRKTVQIVESFINDKGQPRQRIVQHMGVAFDDAQLQQLWTMAEKLLPELEERANEEKLFRNGQLPLFEFSPGSYQQEIPDNQMARVKNMLKHDDVLEGPFEVWGEVFDKIGVEDLLGLSDRGRGSTHALKLSLIAKLCEGGSKRRSAAWLSDQLGLSLSEDRIYRMMDKLSGKTEKVRELGFRCGRVLCENKVSLVLFDVTTLYFESFLDDEDRETEEKPALDEISVEIPKAGKIESGLRRHGFSKDCKFKETQVVLALATSSDGIPLWYDVFPGNTAECSTLKNMLAGISERVDPDELWIVADAAMLTKDNRKILSEAGASYVLGASLKKLRQENQKEALDLGSFRDLDDDRKYRVVKLPDGNTLVITWSGKKAKKDIHDREVLIKRLLKKLDANGEVRVKSLIGNRGTGKYVEPCDSDSGGKYRLNLEKISEEEKYDGLHAVETDLQISGPEDVKSVLAAYGNLWHIEDCFRVSKSDIGIRPVYHWTNRRIRAHIAICFLALLMERYLEKHLLVRRHVSLSARRIKDALLKVNSTLIKDTENDRIYRFPSRLSKDGREIYKAIGLERNLTPVEITSMVNYRRRIPNIQGEVYEESEE